MEKTYVVSMGLDLQLFGEGSGGEGGGTAPTAQTGESGLAAAAQRSEENIPLSKIRYGKQPAGEEDAAPASGAQENSTSEEDLTREFNELIKGKYKDVYGKTVEGIVQKRLKSSKDTVSKFGEVQPLLDILSLKYKTGADDIKSLVDKVNEDDYFFEDAALERGMSTEAVREDRRRDSENAELKRALASERADRAYRELLGEAEAVKNTYPKFDIRAELKNPTFHLLLTNGTPMQKAYEMVHAEEIIPVAMQYSAGKAAEMMSNNVRSGGRPVENGISGQASPYVKTDVSQLTKADRAEIIKRAARGEKIIF